MEEIKKAVERTKSYALKYHQKLSSEQLYLRLISPKKYLKKDIFTYGEKVSINLNNEYKIYLAKELVEKHLKKIKGILLIGITGTVAAEAAKKKDDIDLLIVTKADELWWWRLYLRIYIFWHRIPHRKFKQKEEANDFCFNLWLDEKNLTIPKDKQNLKNASDLIMMKVILDRGNSYLRFLEANQWAKKYLATGFRERLKNINLVESKSFRTMEEKNFLINLIKKITNMVLFGGQYLYMRLRSSKLRVSLGQAFFHEDN